LSASKQKGLRSLQPDESRVRLRSRPGIPRVKLPTILLLYLPLELQFYRGDVGVQLTLGQRAQPSRQTQPLVDRVICDLGMLSGRRGVRLRIRGKWLSHGSVQRLT
jgi:hypothetical protein